MAKEVEGLLFGAAVAAAVIPAGVLWGPLAAAVVVVLCSTGAVGGWRWERRHRRRGQRVR